MTSNGSNQASNSTALTAPHSKLLSGKQALFVANYLTGMTGMAAALAAGYGPKTGSARSAAWKLLNRTPAVMKAVEEGQNKIRDVAEVTAETMLAQFDDDRAFAITTKNATAAVRASEMKAKLAGLLIDRQDIRAVHGIKVEVVRFGEAEANA